MIGRIRGTLIYKDAAEVMVEAGGVGYRLQVSAATAGRLPGLEEEVILWVTTRLKDDAIQLYGFAERREQAMFLRLLKVNGVGPKLAFTIIAGGDVGRLEQQLVNQEVDALCKLPGVGKKLSRRLILELGEVLKKELGSLAVSGLETEAGAMSQVDSEVGNELVAALEALGYRSAEIETLAAKVIFHHSGEPVETLLKLVLQELHRG
jgi:Holliday junction DNA helicase RuvA